VWVLKSSGYEVMASWPRSQTSFVTAFLLWLSPLTLTCGSRVLAFAWSQLLQRERVAPELVSRVEDRPMRKIISLLDEEQREALSELLDFGTAVFSAGLVVAVLKGFVDLLT
jgi:hypothetical protein